MPWSKLSDDLNLHRKPKQAGALPTSFFCCALAHSSKYLTDGVFHPREADDIWAWGYEAESELLRQEFGPELAAALAEHPEALKLARKALRNFELRAARVHAWAISRLQDAGLVDKHGRRGKLRLHNFLQYNLSREQWENRRARAAERQARRRGSQPPRDEATNELATLTVQAEAAEIAGDKATSRRDVGVTPPVTTPPPEPPQQEASQGGGNGPPHLLAAATGPPGEQHGAVSSSGTEAAAAVAAEPLEAQQAEPMHGSRSGQNRPDRAHLLISRPVPSVTRSDRWSSEQVAHSLALLRELRSHPCLAPIASPECAALAVRLMGSHDKSRRAAIGAIGEVARDALAGEAIGRPWSDERLSRMLASYVSHAREPSGQGPLSEAEHTARKRAEAKRYAAERRARKRAEDKALPPLGVAALVAGLLDGIAGKS
jgi:hypothetical protein